MDPEMKLSYTIVYVPDVSASLDFFTRAFGFEPRYLHESGAYGELETGQTVLAFGSHDLGDMKFPNGYVAAHASTKPLGIEIGLTCDDVPSAPRRALEAGGVEVSAPVTKPWGQIVSCLRCPDGSLVELLTPWSPP
jgi:catechol 2,3-dioxygenase-like lactoylglutathione lyase family enzyme